MKLVYAVLFAIIYTVGYVFLAALVTGGGEGNYIVMVPVHISWALNFPALALLFELKYKIARILFVIIMLAYYVILFLMLKEAISEAASNKRILTQPVVCLIPAVWFLAGQGIIWMSLFKEIIKSGVANNSEEKFL